MWLVHVGVINALLANIHGEHIYGSGCWFDEETPRCWMLNADCWIGLMGDGAQISSTNGEIKHGMFSR